MPVKCILTSVRFLDCPVYWLPEERALCWEDRENLVDMSSLASKAFAALVATGRDPQTITNGDLVDEIGDDRVGRRTRARARDILTPPRPSPQAAGEPLRETPKTACQEQTKKVSPGFLDTDPPEVASYWDWDG